MKTCFKCDKTKPLTEFYRHPRMADGRLGKCKECTKRDVRENRRARIDYYTEYEKRRALLPHRVDARNAYAKSAAGKIANSRAKRNWLARNSDKRAAHIILGNAVRAGRITKLPCEVCGSTRRIHGHHDDYAKPLEVVWLCPRHHSVRHAEMENKS